MKKIAILYICTGRYSVFWKIFFKSSEKFLLSNTEKHYFVFTDSKQFCSPNDRVHVIYQKKLGWPYDTLMRFSIFSKIESKLKNFDYIYFFNANLKIVESINEKEFLPLKNDKLVVVLHPGFVGKKRIDFPYEKNLASLAFIPKNKGDFYFAGGLNGGSALNYLKFIKILNTAVKKDYSKKIIAKWHDESHLNKYILNKKIKILNPSFLYPEFSSILYTPKILIIDKNRYGGHEWLRSDKISPFLVVNFIFSITKYYIKLVSNMLGDLFGNN